MVKKKQRTKASTKVNRATGFHGKALLSFFPGKTVSGQKKKPALLLSTSGRPSANVMENLFDYLNPAFWRLNPAHLDTGQRIIQFLGNRTHAVC